MAVSAVTETGAVSPEDETAAAFMPVPNPHIYVNTSVKQSIVIFLFINAFLVAIILLKREKQFFLVFLIAISILIV